MNWQELNWFKKSILIWVPSIALPLIIIHSKIFLFPGKWDTVQNIILNFGWKHDGIIFIFFAVYNLISLGLLFYSLSKKNKWGKGIFYGLFLSFLAGNTVGYIELWHGFLVWSKNSIGWFGIATMATMFLGLISLIVTIPLGILADKIIKRIRSKK